MSRSGGGGGGSGGGKAAAAPGGKRGGVDSKGAGMLIIPGGVKKTIENIKEITMGSHSDEEIYAMLKECSMDPNDTTQKLLLQDTFHEVKRKRDRKKENPNKEPAEPRWKPGMQGRGTKGVSGGRVNYSSRYVSHDAGGGRNLVTGKESGTLQALEKVQNPSPLPALLDTKDKEASSTSLQAPVANGPTGLLSASASVLHDAHASAGRVVLKSQASNYAGSDKFEGPLPQQPSSDANKNTKTLGVGEAQQIADPSDASASISLTPSSVPYFSASDPVLLPSQDSRQSGAVGAIRREVGSQRPPNEQVFVSPVENKSPSGTSEMKSSMIHGKMPNKAQGVGKNQYVDSSQSASSTLGGYPVSRPSSNYNNRSQAVGQQKGPSKEWKPKPTNPSVTQGSETVVSSEVSTVSAESSSPRQPVLSVDDSKDTTSELQRKLEESHISDGQHVIIPDHLHVPETEKFGFCFGSFEASFGFNTSSNEGLESDKSPSSDTIVGIEETANEKLPSNHNASTTAEDVDFHDNPQSSSHGLEKFPSNDGEFSSSVAQEYNEVKQDTAHGSQQYATVQASSNYNFGLVPPALGSQTATFESSESQARDASRLPSFVVHQPFDPTSYYAQFYRSGAETDGRVSPFHSAGVTTKFNGNMTVVSPQTSQSPQEGGNPLLISTTTPSPLMTQAAGVMQNPLSATQQPVPVFRQPAGVHLPHYPPNYIPYGHYFPPFYVPPPAIHQFLGNGAFAQQPQVAGVYPPPPAAKYSIAQHKPAANAGNSTQIGVPGSYGPYGSTPNYNPSSVASAGNPTANDDLAASQFKDGNIYGSGQQSEGSGVWLTPGRDISSLQASSFYNLPQGQVAFTPSQPGHGTFAGIYHPAQPVPASTIHPLLQQSQTMAGPADMVGPAANYQQPQHSQLNWPSNY